jgi:hypothetical protein
VGKKSRRPALAVACLSTLILVGLTVCSSRDVSLTAAPTAGTAARTGPAATTPPTTPSASPRAPSPQLASEQATASSPRTFQKGIAFTGYGRNSYEGEGPLISLRELKETNATWISLLVTAYQPTTASTAIDRTGQGTPTDDSVRRVIQEAHALGLKVMLKPHVDLSAEPTRWRGQIGLGFGPGDWPVWFASYREFILHYARMAFETSCELFCVGCELNGTVDQVGEWRATIAEVKTVYHGPLIYADDQVENAPDAVTWWDALDYIGQDAYPTLTQMPKPSISNLCEGWVRYRDKLWALSQKWGKPVVITEIGYRSVKGGAQNPWDWQRTGPVDLTVQRKAYEAALRMVAGVNFIAGMYWWQWMPDPNHGGPNDTGYSPRGKPAEAALRARYKHVM